MTEWNDRELSPGVSATIKFKGGEDRAVISVDEDRVSRACFFVCLFVLFRLSVCLVVFFFFYIRVKKLFP